MPSAEGNIYKRLKFTKKHSRHFLKKQSGSLFSGIKTQTKEKDKIVKDLLRKFHFQKTAT